MLVYAAVAVVTFGLSLVVAGGVGAGLAWDLLTGLGFLALAIMLALFIDTGRGGRLVLHRTLGWVAVFLVVCHGFGLWWTHPVSLEYVSLSGPLYIGMGLVSAVLLLALVQSAEPDHRSLFGAFESFRSLHWLLAVGALFSGLYHVLASGLYFNAWEAFLVTCACLVVVILPRLGVRVRGLRSATGQRLLLASLGAVTGFVCFKYLA